MNFQQVRNTLGQFEPGTEYNIKTTANCTIKRYKPVEYSKSSGKPGQSLALETDEGDEDWVKLGGKFDPIDDNYLGKVYEFLIWPFKPDQATKTYLYCWIQRQTPSQSTPQASPQAAQATKVPPGIDTQSQILEMAERFLAAIESLIYPNAKTERPTQPSGVNPENKRELTPEEEADSIPF